MEKINIHSEELELNNLLLAVVNSKEEFDYLIAEKTRLSFLLNIAERRCSKW